MTTQEAKTIKRQYSEYDEEFRAAKKRGDHRKASQWKAKRDALDSKLSEAHKVLRNA